MATAPLELESEPSSAEHKSFWGHLEDLRQALIRSAIAIGVALLLCMLFTNKLVNLIEYPLRHIDLFEKPKPTVSFQLGATRLGPYVVSREQFAGLPEGAAPHVVFQVGTTNIGQEQVVTLKLAPNAPADDTNPLHVRLH